MSSLLYDDELPSRQFGKQVATKQAQANKERSQALSDEYNGRLLRRNPLLARLMAAYTKCDEANREELVRLAELACTAPGGIV